MSHIADHESKSDLDVLRHSTAHVLAAAVTRLWPDAKYAIGPPIEDGFYYDFELSHQLTNEDLPVIEKEMRRIAESGAPFVQEMHPKPEALEIFQGMGQDYKVELISERVAEGEPVSLYRTGDFLDLCRGPHVPTAKQVRAFRLQKLAGAYWRGDEHNKMLQRVYGTAFPTRDELEAHLRMLEEAERRDHKKLGRELKLFMLDERTGAGLPIWLPNGATVRREIERFVVDEEVSRGYQHVRTPNVARLELFETSGHWQRYHESMYPPMRFEDSGEVLELRPMNCPHHILVYQSELRSYRDLPLRIAEVGTNWRFEKSGTLQGLNRVRAFDLNDAHIFCTPEQLQAEVMGSIELALYFSEVLGIEEFWYRLSLKDDVKDKWVGGEAEWQKAEAALRAALDALGQEYRVGPGEAAFYGPKIDFQVRDVQRREFTNSTVQVDFQLPAAFDLEYVAEDGSRQRPIMVHRGAAGSMERLFSYLIERYAGAFPTWMAPVQVTVIPITDNQADYARKVADRLRALRLRVHLDDRSERMQKKIREAQRAKVPYMAIVGAREAEAGQVNVRDRAGEETPEDLEAFAQRVAVEVAERRR